MADLSKLSDEELLAIAKHKKLSDMTDEELKAIAASNPSDSKTSTPGVMWNPKTGKTQPIDIGPMSGALNKFVKGATSIPFTDRSILPESFNAELSQPVAGESPTLNAISGFAGDVVNPMSSALVKGVTTAVKIPAEKAIEYGAEKLKPLLEKHATNVVASFKPSTLKIADQIMSGVHDFKNKVKDLGKFITDNSLLKNSSEDTAKAALELKDKLGTEIKNILETSKTPTIDVRETIYTPIEKFLQSKMKNATTSMKEAYQKVIDEFAHMKDERYKNVQDVWETMKNFDDSINWNQLKAGTADATEIAKSKVRGDIKKIIDNTISDRLGNSAAKDFLAYNYDWQKALAVEKMAQKSEVAGQAMSGQWTGPLKTLTKAGYPGARANRALQSPNIASNITNPIADTFKYPARVLASESSDNNK